MSDARTSAAAAAAAAAEALRLLQSGLPEQALGYAERAVAGTRVCLPAHGLLATVLMRLGRSTQAEQAIAHALSLGPGVADAYDALAFVSMALGRHEQANALYRRATQLGAAEPRLWYNLACSERSLGRLDEAEAACDRAVALDRTQYPSYLLRSELRVQSAQANHIAELMERLQGAASDYRARVFLGYALGKELDDLGRYDEAFRAFASAARARRSRLDYDVATDVHKLARIAASYPSAAHSGNGREDGGERYIFIVGLPRSGTTLLERILGGLPGVRSNGETGNLSRALLGAARGTGDVFARAAAADADAVAAAYARLADPGPAARHIIEKLPLNYLYLGAIHRALPQARLLHVARAPLDSCFAMYRTLFAAGYPFSYDLAELGRYYAAYQGLMNHWRTTLGDALHEVRYEELVREPRRVGAELAQYCGLAWNETAIEIQNNKSASLTASASQVRRPIYGSSSGRWRHYVAHLAPLIDTLRAHAVALPEVTAPQKL